MPLLAFNTKKPNGVLFSFLFVSAAFGLSCNDPTQVHAPKRYDVRFVSHSRNLYTLYWVSPYNAIQMNTYPWQQRPPPLSLGYIGEFEIVDDHRANKIVIELTGRLNKCGIISPRFDVEYGDIEKWIVNLLPSRQFGHIILSTTYGIMTHEEARRKKTGGKILGFFYWRKQRNKTKEATRKERFYRKHIDITVAYASFEVQVFRLLSKKWSPIVLGMLARGSFIKQIVKVKDLQRVHTEMTRLPYCFQCLGEYWCMHTGSYTLSESKYFVICMDSSNIPYISFVGALCRYS